MRPSTLIMLFHLASQRHDASSQTLQSWVTDTDVTNLNDVLWFHHMSLWSLTCLMHSSQHSRGTFCSHSESTHWEDKLSVGEKEKKNKSTPSPWNTLANFPSNLSVDQILPSSVGCSFHWISYSCIQRQNLFLSINLPTILSTICLLNSIN